MNAVIPNAGFFSFFPIPAKSSPLTFLIWIARSTVRQSFSRLPLLLLPLLIRPRLRYVPLLYPHLLKMIRDFVLCLLQFEPRLWAFSHYASPGNDPHLLCLGYPEPNEQNKQAPLLKAQVYSFLFFFSLSYFVISVCPHFTYVCGDLILAINFVCNRGVSLLRAESIPKPLVVFLLRFLSPV